jgi:cobalt-zinc-cadmium efflux system outer membrane protein
VVSFRTLHVAALVLVAALQPSRARAQDGDTLRLADVVAEARRANPMLQAARFEADALGERGSQAGALPDPVLSLGLRNRPLDDFGADQMMTMNWIGLSQTFPWPGNQGFGQRRQEHYARAGELDADEKEAALVARVKEVYFHLAFMDRALGIMASTRELLRDFLEVTSAKYAVGAGLQQDILQAQVAIAQVTADITIFEENRVAMAARLNSLLGRPATEPVGSLELPDPAGELPPVDSLMEVAAINRPAIRAARERALAAEAGYRAAQRDAYPDFRVTLGYGQRPQYEDLATIEVGISLPLWSERSTCTTRRLHACRSSGRLPSGREISPSSTEPRSSRRHRPPWNRPCPHTGSGRWTT